MSQLVFPCDKIPEFAYDYLEHRLPKLTAIRFETHLKFCEGCSEFVQLYRMAADPSRFLEETAVPPDLVDHTLKFLEQELEKSGRP